MIWPLASTRTGDLLPTFPTVGPSQAALAVDLTYEEASGDNESVSKRTRVD